MDLSHRLHSHLLLQKISARLSSLPRPRLRIPQHSSLRAAYGIALIAFSLVLGLLARETTRSEWVRTFQRENAPSPRIWEHALKPYGWSPVTQPSTRHAILRSLPLQGDTQSTAWWNGEFQMLVVFPVQMDNHDPLVLRPSHAKGKPGARQAWEFLGVGWDALGQTEDRIKKLPSAPTPISSSRPKSAPRDPREILY